MIPVTEAQLQRRVTDLADWLGLDWYHDVDSRRNRAGFPDLIIAGHHGVVAWELKTETGRVRAEQRRWIDRLHGATIDAGFVRPADWEHVEAELRRIAGRT